MQYEGFFFLKNVYFPITILFTGVVDMRYDVMEIKDITIMPNDSNNTYTFNCKALVENDVRHFSNDLQQSLEESMICSIITVKITTGGGKKYLT